MKINKIIWMEDTWEPISYIAEKIELLAKSKKIALIKVEQPEDVIKLCEDYRLQKDPDYLLILDLLIGNKEQIVIPETYYNPPTTTPKWFPTINGTGHDVGLLLYEKLFIDAVVDKNGIDYQNALLPPPVAFLSVSELDYARHKERFDRIILAAKSKLGSSFNESQFKWISKFGFNIQSIVNILDDI